MRAQIVILGLCLAIGGPGAAWATPPDLPGTTWTFTDDSTIVYEADGTVRRGWGEPRVGRVAQSGDRADVTFGAEVHTIRLLDACHLTHFEPAVDTYWFATRSKPACAPDEVRYSELANTMWTFMDGHTLLVGDVAAQRSWGTPTKGTSRVQGNRAELAFGSESTTVTLLDACHLLYPTPDGTDTWGATRVFPSCGPAICTYKGVEWSHWRFTDGSSMRLRADGTAWRSWGESTGTWNKTTGGFDTTFGAEVVAFTLVEPCTLTANPGGEEWRAKREFPTCGCN
ncbi:MAG: hypothetical protein JRJ84_19710 [Deltaproteobacteria bacterium]|nr:hypothetical protein [Deltaproteobacteria bacterium]